MSTEAKQHLAINESADGVATYTPGKPSPSGKGYLARFEKVGTVMEGFDKNEWVVKAVTHGKGKKQTVVNRWFKVKKERNEEEKSADEVAEQPPKKKRALYVEEKLDDKEPEKDVVVAEVVEEGSTKVEATDEEQTVDVVSEEKSEDKPEEEPTEKVAAEPSV